MSQIRIAVVGTGHLGKIHARLLQEQTHAQLVAVVDPQQSARDDVAQELGTQSFADVSQLPADIDAAIVAAPTCRHASLGEQLLERGVHVLMEKPLARNSAEAQQLVDLARQQNCVLQVGHVERFNPALQSVTPLIQEPKYIEARRLSSYSFRSTDIGVVLDLMIHDLDVILNLVDSEVVRVQALGTSVLGGHEDMAQARLEFRNGCVANITASRTSQRPSRTMSIYCPHLYAGIDFGERTAEVIRPRNDVSQRQFSIHDLTTAERADVQQDLFNTLLPCETIVSETCNPLADEQRDFLQAIATGQPPRVTGHAGLAAVQLADRVCESLASHGWNGTSFGPVGPHALPGPSIVPLPATPDRWRKAG